MRNYSLRILFTFMFVVAAAGTATTVSADNSSTVSAEQANVLKRGKLMWLRCAACHDLNASNEAQVMMKIGPNMQGVIGREAGSLEGFAYSDALRDSGLTWDKETLSRWIEKPTELVPGTLMSFIGLPKESDRQALIEYIESETSE